MTQLEQILDDAYQLRGLILSDEVPNYPGIDFDLKSASKTIEGIEALIKHGSTSAEKVWIRTMRRQIAPSIARVNFWQRSETRRRNAA